jgi:hypothetical protein
MSWRLPLGMLAGRGGAVSTAAAYSVPLEPDDVSGLALWLKADSLTLSDTDPVSTWADSSGNGRDATQTLTKRPLYRTNQKHGLPGVVFDGTDDCLVTAAIDLTGTDKLTLFAVVSASATGTHVIVEMSANLTGQVDSFVLDRATNNTIEAAHVGNIGSQASNSGGTITTTPRLVTAIHDKGASLIATEEVSAWVGGIPYQWYAYSVNTDSRTGLSNNTNSFGNRVLNIGARNNGASLPLNGTIYELVIYGALLTGPQIAGIEWYLNDKWELS